MNLRSDSRFGDSDAESRFEARFEARFELHFADSAYRDSNSTFHSLASTQNNPLSDHRFDRYSDLEPDQDTPFGSDRTRKRR